MSITDSRQWYADNENVRTLVNYLAARGDSAETVAAALLNPPRFEEAFRTAQVIVEERSA